MIAALRRLYVRVRVWLATDPPDRDDPDDRVW